MVTDQALQPKRSELTSFVTFRISRTYAELNRQAYRALAQVTALSLSQWRILSIIHMETAVSAAQVARYADLDKGQISRAVKGLISRGFVESSADKSDRRSQVLSLTKAGKAEHERVINIMRQRQALLTEGVSKEDLETFKQVLDKLHEHAREDIL